MNKEYAIDIDGTTYELVPRDLEKESQIRKICLEELDKPRKKNYKLNLLFIFRKKYPELLQYIFDRTPLLKDDFYRFQTRIVWTLNGLTEHPKCKNEKCRKSMIRKNMFISKDMRVVQFCNGVCCTSDKDVIEKRRQTNLKKYGVDWSAQSEEIKQRERNHCLSAYGTEYYFQSDDFRNKATNTWKEKYGVDNPWKAEKIKDKISETWMKKYGVKHYSKSEDRKNKIRKTCLERYNAESWIKSEVAKKTANDRKIKEIETKRIRKTLTTSKFEENVYQLLLEKFSEVKRQYKSELYPHHCDFYIPSINTYIEIQGNWTHGKHPFDPNNPKDHEQKQFLEEKAKTSKYYAVALNVWTISDPSKRETAKKNNLNYLEFWNIEDVKNWLKTV